MGTYCAPLVADIFRFCYDRDFMMPLSDDNMFLKGYPLEAKTAPKELKLECAYFLGQTS